MAILGILKILSQKEKSPYSSISSAPYRYFGKFTRTAVTLDKWMGRLKGRLALLAVTAGTLFSVLSGSSIACTAVLGSLLVPEMENRGYKKPMSIGPILGSGGLAMMIPPSGLGVLVAAIGEISIGKMLIAIAIPGLLLAAFYSAYIIVRCQLQPHLAPIYEVPRVPLSEKLWGTVRYVLPLGFIIFAVLGFIFFGITTPTEAAGTGVFGCLVLAILYRRLGWSVLKKSFSSTLEITVMVFMVITGANAFSQLLAFTQISRGLVEFTATLPMAPIFVVIAMQVALGFLGMFMGSVATMMITLPIFMPVIISLGFDPVWFGVIFLLNIEMAQTTPPYGMNLFVMKGVSPQGTTMGEIWVAAVPFLFLDSLLMILIIAFPNIALWLPGIMR